MNISQRDREILVAVQCDGDRAVIVERLDRAEYKRIDDILEALGGKWSRRAKVHVFEDGIDAAVAIDAAMAAGEVETAREQQKSMGFFETPEKLARELVGYALVMPGCRVLEPSAGTGTIARAAVQAGGIVTVVERNERLRFALRDDGHFIVVMTDDFLDVEVPPIGYGGAIRDGYDRVVMNPPFCTSGRGDHLDHVIHAYRLLALGGILVSVVPAGVEFRQDRRYREFREFVKGKHGEIERLPEGSFKESGTMVNTCTVRMRREAP